MTITFACEEKECFGVEKKKLGIFINFKNGADYWQIKVPPFQPRSNKIDLVTKRYTGWLATVMVIWRVSAASNPFWGHVFEVRPPETVLFLPLWYVNVIVVFFSPGYVSLVGKAVVLHLNRTPQKTVRVPTSTYFLFDFRKGPVLLFPCYLPSAVQ